MTNNIDTSLLLRLEASLTKFEKQMKKATDVGEKTALNLQQKFDRSHKKMSSSARHSAHAIAQEMDRLKLKYDPIYAASLRYEKELNELNRAHLVGAINTKQYGVQLEALNGRYTKTIPKVGQLKKGMFGLTTQTKGGAGGIQNVSYQIGDFATQVGAGTAASVALGQQLPQLLGGFGALGAVLGAVVAVGVPLAAFLLSGSEKASAMQKSIDALKEAVSEYQSAVKAATLPTADLAKKYGVAARAAREFLSELSKIEGLEAKKALDDLVASFGKFDDKNFGRGANYFRASVRRLSEQLALTTADATTLARAFEALQDAKGPERQVEAFKKLQRIAEQVLGPVEQMPDEARELYQNILKAGEAAARVAKASEDMKGGIKGATSEAEGLVTQLSRAVTQMKAIADASLAELGDQEVIARINLETAGDPVKRAGELAVHRYRRELEEAGASINSALSAEEAIEFGTKENEIRSAAEALERLKIKANEADTSYNDLMKTLKKKAEFDAFSLGEDQLLKAEQNMEMLGKTSAEVATLRAKYAMLAEAKRRDIDLNTRSAETGLSVAETIDQNAKKVGELTSAYEQAAQQNQFFADANQKLKNGILDAIVEGENFVGVLEDIAKSFAKAALEAALFGSGPLAGAGGGLLGGIFNGGGGGLFGGKIIPGILHAGGTAGRDGYGHNRAVSSSVFNNAPRYHNGGVAGLRPNEVPAILERGERVIPNSGRRSSNPVGSALGGEIRVVITASEKFDAQVSDQIKGASVAIKREAVQEALGAVQDQQRRAF